MFLKFRKIRSKLLASREHRQRQFLRRNSDELPDPGSDVGLYLTDSESGDSTFSSSSNTGFTSDTPSSDDSLSPFLLSDTTDSTSTSEDIEMEDEDDLEGESDSEDEDQELSESDDGHLADIEDWMEDLDEPQPDFMAKLSRIVRNEYEQMYASRYQVPRRPFPRPPPDLPHLLNVIKVQRPDHFRKSLRVSPSTFDRLIERLQDDPVFSSGNSPNKQTPVEYQLAVTLYRFGHFGNAASIDDIAKWSGLGKGTIFLVTHRVMTAVLRKDFMEEATGLPTEEEKEEAKRWIEKHSCEAWRDGWCMVDGTLIPLYERPFWFGESYFDRKHNYSLNIQV